MAVGRGALEGLNYFLFSFASFFVALRLYVRLYLLRSFSGSDAFILIAWAAYGLGSIIDIVNSRSGYIGPDITFGDEDMAPDLETTLGISTEKLVGALKLAYGAGPLFTLAVFSVKMAFLLFYRQLFPPGRTKLRFAMYFTMGLVISGAFSITIITLFWCRPISRNWSSTKSSRCLSWAASEPFLVQTCFHIITDILIYAMPFFILPSLRRHATRTEFIALLGLFSLGFITLLCTTGRIVSNVRGNSDDDRVLEAWVSAEQSSVLVVACCTQVKWALLGKPLSRLFSCFRPSRRGSVGNIPAGGGGGGVGGVVGVMDKKNRTVITPKNELESDHIILATRVENRWDEESGAIYTVRMSRQPGETDVDNDGEAMVGLAPRPPPHPARNLKAVVDANVVESSCSSENIDPKGDASVEVDTTGPTNATTAESGSGGIKASTSHLGIRSLFSKSSRSRVDAGSSRLSNPTFGSIGSRCQRSTRK